MAQQHDLDLENATGAAFRADLNLALKAISQKQWGPTSPPTVLAYQDYVDTSGSKPKFKVYDGASHVVMAALDTTNHLWLPVIGGGNGTIASASTTDLATIDESGISVTGTTTITSLGTIPKGQIKRLTFAASLTLTHNGTSLILPGSKNIQTQAGDTCLAESLGSGNWRIYSYTPAAGIPNAGLLSEATVASAATADIGAALSNIVKITGTTTITSLGSSASLLSPLYFIRFTGALTFTHNATSLIIPGGANITTADGDTATALYLGSGNWLILHYSKATGAAVINTAAEKKLMTASVAANALTATINPCSLDFRSATLTSGTVNNRTLATAASLTVASGATLGTTSGNASRLVLLALDNAGTIEPAIVNFAGGVNLNEEGVISTTALSGSSNSATVIYSTTARTNVPYRVIGFIDSTQATAGTWATTPSLLVGAGGNVATAMGSIGYGQTWQTVTRNLGTTYYNTTGKPIVANIVVSATTGGGSLANVAINGGTPVIISFNETGGVGSVACGSIIIPVGASYVISGVNATAPTVNELR